MRTGRRWMGAMVAGAMLAAAAGQALAQGEASEPDSLKLSAGGDIRIRQVFFKDIPIKADPPGVTRGGENHFFRFRTRVWGELDAFENITVYGRLANEFREYVKPDNEDWEKPDEVIVDNLYLDVRNLFGDRVDLRIGRQDLVYGTGKVLLEGTPKDGSRTIYSDAVKLTWKGLDPAASKTSIDFLGIYNEPENHLAYKSEERDLTGLVAGFNDMRESGGGVYVKNKMSDSFSGEYYYFYKEESEWSRMVRNAAGEMEERVTPKLELNTVGARLMPKFTDRFSANVEGAYQFGERGEAEVQGLMVDAFLRYALPWFESMNPVVGAGIYYLSGSEPGASREKGWNPLWARWPQYSELYIYAYDADGAGRWSNVSMPHVDLTFSPFKGVKTAAMVGYMMAPEEDGPGGGDERGLLGTMRTDFTVRERLLTSKDKLTGHLLFEVVDPGDYYSSERHTAYFARWELMYAF